MMYSPDGGDSYTDDVMLLEIPMDKLKIFVACHKRAEVYKDEVYLPIQVGKSLHPDLDLGFLCDNSGDNISSKNSQYSELTAQYWIWKNVSDVKYVGLCHYGRYFETKFSNANIDEFLGEHNDIILCRQQSFKICVANHLQVFTSLEDVYIFYKCLLHKTQSEKSLIDAFLSQNRFSPRNMFIMRKELFNEFAEWEFAILEEAEKYMKFSPYTRGMRSLGYLSEPLLSLFCSIRKLRVHYEDIVPMVGEKAPQIKFRSVKEKIRDIRFKLLSPEPNLNDITVINGLRGDGVDF